MEASDLLIKAIKQFEGYRDVAYLDSASVPTIAWGHTKGVKLGMKCTRSEADRWLREDLAPIEAYLNTIPEVDTQGKYDALCSFIFNLGTGKFKGSTLLKKIKAGAPTEEIQAEFRRWVYAKGKKLKGLVRRREWEARRFAE